MILAVGIAIGLMITFFILWDEYPFYGVTDVLLCIAQGGLITFLLSLLFMLFTLLISIPFYVEVPEVEIVEKPIYALQDNFNIEGRYSRGVFYGSGYIDETLNYFFLADEQKGRKVNHVIADKTYIKPITENEEPSIEYHYKDTIIESKIGKVLCYPLGEENNRQEDYYVLNVPEDSMTTEFSVDLQ